MHIVFLEIFEPLLTSFGVKPKIEGYYNYKCTTESHYESVHIGFVFVANLLKFFEPLFAFGRFHPKNKTTSEDTHEEIEKS